jgi:hypothetical protein
LGFQDKKSLGHLGNSRSFSLVSIEFGACPAPEVLNLKAFGLGYGISRVPGLVFGNFKVISLWVCVDLLFSDLRFDFS